jgi:hypothetical protein
MKRELDMKRGRLFGFECTFLERLAWPGWRLLQQGSHYKPVVKDSTISVPCSCS